MSQKKLKRNKGAKKPQRIMPNIDVYNGEGFYGLVEKILGGNLISVKLNDNTVRQAKIPGKFYKKVWIKTGSKVLLNNDLEVVYIIKETDSKAVEADKMLRKANNDGNNIFNEYSDSSDEEDMTDPIKNINNIDKTKELLAKKEKDKLKDADRKVGKVFRDSDEIEKDMKELNIDDI
jgi:initiation factor 1A